MIRRIEIDAEQFTFDRSAPTHWHVHLGGGQPALDLFTAGAGRGPTVLVCGGTHGDEFEGQMAALDLARALPDLTVRGRLCILPFHHPAACRAGRRRSPLDGVDLNRIYGLDHGADPGPTASIAAFVQRALLPDATWVIDLHSGGRATEFVVSSNLQATPGSDEYHTALPALLAFDAPYAIVFDEAGETAMPHRGTLEGAARALGTHTLSSELGGGGRMTAGSLRVARQGLANVLSHLGVVPSPAARRWQESRSLLLSLTRPDQHIAAEAPGWFCPNVALGDHVRAGDRIGTLVMRDEPFAAARPILTQAGGLVVALSASTLVEPGTRLAFIAEPMPPAV